MSTENTVITQQEQAKTTGGLPERHSTSALRKFTTVQLLNLCLGFFGLQFAWQMRIILSGPVTENLGASPLIFGLIWLAGPVTGMVVQPIIGAMSDSTYTRFGRRRPYLLVGAILASLALWALPNSSGIANTVSSIFNTSLPTYAALVVAAIMIWAIDASVNAAQGPYRALVPDTIVPEQHSVANSYFSFAIGLGSVIAAGTAPLLKMAFNYQMSIEAQFVMAAIAFSAGMIWTCMTIKEVKQKTAVTTSEAAPKTSFVQNLMEFMSSSPEVFKICGMQFFTWIGVMSMFIFFTQFAIHNLFSVPNLTAAAEGIKNSYSAATISATNFSSICFAIFNLICFAVSIPIGTLSSRFGNKKIHIISLVSMSAAFLGMAFTSNTKVVTALMAISGIGWASLLALPFAMLSQYIKKGTEGAVMGIFNIFIAGPQVLVCTLLAWFINKSSFMTSNGLNNHWEYAFIVGGVSLLIAAAITSSVKEEKTQVNV